MSLSAVALVERSSAVVTLLPSRTRGRPKTCSDEDLIETVVVRAMDMYLERGFIAMRMEDVATACKVSKRTIYRLFPSKLDLFREFAIRHRRTMVVLPMLDDDLPLEDALMRIFAVDLDPQQDFRRLSFLLRVLADAARNPELSEILLREGCEKSKALLSDWFRRRKARGGTNIGDPNNAASIMMNMVFGAIALQPMGSSYWPGGADRRAYLKDCIRYFVNGAK